MITFETLPGLPGEGPLPEQFALPGRSTHSEGHVVAFASEDGDKWIGNFQYGMGACSKVLQHPNDLHVVVIARGCGYVLDPRHRKLMATIGVAIEDAQPIPERKMIVLNHQGLFFEALGPEGRVWRTRRLSWDGFANVVFTSTAIQGVAWEPSAWGSSERRIPFEVDLTSGRSTGGSFRQRDDPYEQLYSHP